MNSELPTGVDGAPSFSHDNNEAKTAQLGTPSDSASRNLRKSIGRITADFLVDCQFGRGLAAATLRAYRIDLAQFTTAIGPDTAVDGIGKEQIRDYVRGLLAKAKLKSTSVKRKIATIKALFSWAEREELVTITPFHRLILVIHTPRRLPRAINNDELQRLIEVVSSDDEFSTKTWRLGLLLLVTTGLRIAELCGIKIQDICLSDDTIQVVGKGDRERKVFLTSPEPRSLLEAYLCDRAARLTKTDRLLITPDGEAVSPQCFRRWLRKIADLAGISRRITPHMLRHTAACLLVEKGVNLRIIQRLLGHSSIATTQIYTQIADRSVKDSILDADVLGDLDPSDD